MCYKDLKTIENFEKIDSTLEDYNYQNGLTEKLDKLSSNFDQEIINEIVLWKVNRYADLKQDALKLINEIDENSTEFNKSLTIKILEKLLDKDQKGIQLAMASTILRFKNPNVYQIIDQRVYRFITGEIFEVSKTPITEQIELYITYLRKLREICKKYGLQFKDSDRLLYLMDKKYNSKIKLK